MGEEDVLQKIIQNPNGTISRPPWMFPTVPPSTTDPSSLCLSKDVSLNTLNDSSTFLRLFLPRDSIHRHNTTNKLPIIIYVHGGGFIFVSAAHPKYHDLCSYAAARLPALVVSVEYRLAPEHRLPAAFDDVLEALAWVTRTDDEWVTDYADLKRCFLMEDSAGGNIVYNAGLKAASIMVDDLTPLGIKGLVLIQPYFSGLDRTGSELRLVNDPILPLVNNDACWELSLPVGANRDHEYCDPVRDGGSGLLDLVRDLGWRVWVVSCDGDPLFDRSVELVKLMEEKGVDVKSMFREGGEHGMFVGNPAEYKADVLLDFFTSFLPS